MWNSLLNMFSGIIKEVGELIRVGTKLEVKTDLVVKEVELGSSVAVNGVCLTVEEIKHNALVFDVMPVTLEKSTLSDLKVGDNVNLESSLKLGDEVGGHFVYGHVDSLGEVKNISKQEDSTLFEISADKTIMKYIAPQGSISVNGISLTIANFNEDSFTVSLVPFTIDHTNFASLNVGDKVNLEVDMLAKYAEKVLNYKR